MVRSAIEKLAGKKILVTGGGGFIGRNLTDKLYDAGAEVHCTSRSVQTKNQKAVWWQGVFDDHATAKNLLHAIKPDIIFHLSGHVTAANGIENILPAYHSHVTSTINLLTLAADLGCERIILTGSSNEPLDEMPAPNSPYAAAKWTQHVYGHLFHRLYKLPVVVARPFVGYGPGQGREKLIPYVILSLLRGENPPLSNGRWKTDWIYIDDMVEGILQCALVPGIEGTTLDIGSGKLTSVREIVEKIVTILKPKAQPLFGALPDRYVEHSRIANTQLTFSKLNWKPEMNFDDGLKKTVEWFNIQG